MENQTQSSKAVQRGDSAQTEQGEQNRPLTLAEFILQQRQILDQVRNNFENSLSQMAQTIEQQSLKIEELEKKSV